MTCFSSPHRELVHDSAGHSRISVLGLLAEDGAVADISLDARNRFDHESRRGLERRTGAGPEREQANTDEPGTNGGRRPRRCDGPGRRGGQPQAGNTEVER